MSNRTAVPTAEQRRDIGHRAAINLGLTVADMASRANVTDEAGLYDLITTQASTRTWDAILSASWEDVASAGIPGSVLDAGVRKGFTRETVGRLVQEAAQAVFDDEPKPGPGPIPDGTLVEWTGVDPYGTNLIAGDLIRVVSSGDNGDATDSISYEVTNSGDSNGPDGHGIFSVRPRHIKRPTITSGDGRLAFTLGTGLYSSAVEAGTKVEVRSGPDGDGDFYCRTVDSQQTCYYKADGLEPWTPARQAFEDAKDDAAKVAEMTEQVVASQPEVLSLQRQVESLRQQVTDLNRWRSQALTDMSTASERLIDESTRRNWCSEYDQIIDDINGRMNVLEFAQRDQEVDMEAEVEAEVTVELNGYQLSGTITVNVSYTGLSDEDPCDADYISDGSVESAAADALGVSYRYVSVDSWSVESYDSV